MNIDEISSLCFWAFKYFAETFLFKDNKNKVEFQDMFVGVKTTLQTISPSTSKMLEDRKISSFKFCSDDIKAFFLNDRTLVDSQLYLSSLFMSDDKNKFIQYTLCTILTLLQDRFKDIPNDDMKSFQTFFENLLPTLDIRLIIYNVENLMEFRNIETN